MKRHNRLHKLAFSLCFMCWGLSVCPGLWGLAWGDTMAAPPPTESRMVLPEWQYPPGPGNRITDVPGVQVGQVTLHRTAPVPIHTGVTALLPHSGNLATTGLWAAGRMVNGNGELTGLDFIRTSGILNSPIVLTNTLAVGEALTGVLRYYALHYPGTTPGSTLWPGLLPVVGECYDGAFNSIETSSITPALTVEALEAAHPGAFSQGRVGAGSGMRAFGLHAGIGTASRQVTLGQQTYTLGVLVNANHSRLEALRPTLRTLLEARLHQSLDTLKSHADQDRVQRPPLTRQGSIMVIIATDAPLLPHELDALVTRGALGIGATGSTMDTTSGDGILAFSTATLIPLGDEAPALLTSPSLHPDSLSPLYGATVEAVTEAQLNALLYANPPE